MSKPTARQRSPFGQFQLKGSHLRTDLAPQVPRPKAIEMAAMRREGKTFEEISEAVGLTVRTVKGRLSEAGFKSDGNPRPAK